MTLADKLAEAQRAEVRPRNRVRELEAALDTALKAKDYGAAEQAQADLGPARDTLAIAEGMTRGLAAGQEALDAQRAAEQRAIDEAKQHDQAQQVIAEAMEADKLAVDGIEQSLAEMFACLDAAQAAYHQALSWETAAGQARQRMINVRVQIGELSSPGPRANAPNRASVLADEIPAVRELAKWRR